MILYSQLPHLNRGDWEAFERVVYSCVTGMPPTHVHTHTHSHARAPAHTHARIAIPTRARPRAQSICHGKSGDRRSPICLHERRYYTLDSAR